MKIKLIFFLTALLIMVSCSERNKEKNQQEKTEIGLPVIKIRPPEGELPDLKLSEIAEDIKYIKLETTDECLLDYGVVYYSKDSKYIFINSARKLYQFDTSGKFIRKIGRSGQGPNEFILQRLAVDFENEILYIYPLYGRDYILRFDFDGKPIGKIKNELLIYPEILTTLNSQLIYANNPIPNIRKEYKGGYMQLLSFNPKENKINYYLPNYYHFHNDRKKYKTYIINGAFTALSRHSKKLYYWCAYKDTMYQITSDTISPYIIMYLGKYKFDYKNIELSIASYKYDKNKVYSNKIFIRSMKFTNKHILFNLFLKKEDSNSKWFIAVYNRENKEIKYYNHLIQNDLDGMFALGLSKLGVNLMMIDMLKDPNYILHKKNKKYPLKLPNHKDELRNILDNSKIDDNPIISIITMKEDF